MLSTDRVVHELYEDDDVVSAVVARFGDAIERDGVVDRAALARVAFATPEDREWLEGLLWPRVGSRMAAWRASFLSAPDPPRALVVEVPTLEVPEETLIVPEVETMTKAQEVLVL